MNWTEIEREAAEYADRPGWDEMPEGYHRPETEVSPQDAAQPMSAKLVSASPYQWRDPSTLPRRPWIYGRHLLRGSVFVVVAPGATGKSSLFAGTAMALCTGRPLLGAEVWGGPKRVWIWNLEDSLNDLSFSIQAAALHWGLNEGDLAGRLFVDSGLEGATLKLARQGRNGPEIDRDVADGIRDELLSRAVDVLIVDPFISSHGLGDENDNASIDLVAKEWSRIAVAAKCAVVLVHHSKKMQGAEVTAESARGASSLVDAARGGFTLNTMTKAEASSYGIDADKRRRYFRADDAKPNRAPPGGGRWYFMESVFLGNGENDGDSVGVATPWAAPDPFDDVSLQHLRLVQAKVADGRWRKDVQADDWVGKAIADVLGVDLGDASETSRVKAILKQWINNGVLKVVSQKDAKSNLKPFVVVGELA